MIGYKFFMHYKRRLCQMKNLTCSMMNLDALTPEYKAEVL